MQHPSDINPTIAQVAHTAATYLHRLAKTGIPAPSLSAPWSKQHLHQVYRRGAHSSALHKFQDFLLDDMLDMVRKKYWVVLPFHTVKHLPNLKLAPAGVVPQCTRRLRPIIDYTFTGVNQSSAPLSPMNSMQFGSTIHRILQHIAYSNPKFGPLLMSKIDLLDGYYRVPLSPSAPLKLAVVLPPLKRKGNNPLIGIPLVLPMGWKYSPPFFCAYTETATDLVNSTLNLSTTSCTTWLLWEDFCDTLAVDPTGTYVPGIIPLLQVFAHRYRTGEISPSQSAVRGRTVGDALRAVGQTMAHMGLDNPRLQPSGKLDLRLSRLLSAYNKADPPPARVKSIPLVLIRHTCDLQRQSNHPLGHAIADMLTLGFFFLL